MDSLTSKEIKEKLPSGLRIYERTGEVLYVDI